MRHTLNTTFGLLARQAAVAAATTLAMSAAMAQLAQSPIDITSANTVYGALPPLVFNYGNSVAVSVVNTGSPGEEKTIRASVGGTQLLTLSGVDYKTNKNNLYIVAVSISAGMIPLVAPAWSQHMPHGLHPLLESGILLTTICAVILNLFFNGGGSAEASEREARIAAMQADGAH